MKRIIEKRSNEGCTSPPECLICLAPTFCLSVCLSCVFSASPVTAQFSPVRFGNNKGARKRACFRGVRTSRAVAWKDRASLLLAYHSGQQEVPFVGRGPEGRQQILKIWNSVSFYWKFCYSSPSALLPLKCVWHYYPELLIMGSTSPVESSNICRQRVWLPLPLLVQW
jgi:hypothetical protein